MLNLLALSLLGISFLGSVSLFLWRYSRYSWLDKICTLLVISLPFERIPSLDLGGANLRIGQLLVVFGFWTLIILFLKKDTELLKSKFHNIGYLMVLFLVLSIPSWLAVADQRRFWITSLATWLSFGATFLLANFSKNIYQKLKYLVVSLAFACIFGVYQFLGDLVGLPITLTGLREQYTKIVFGIPRIHSTALEPLYFAGMLFLPIFFCIFVTLAKKRIFTKISGFYNFLFLFLFLTIFTLTLSKSAYLALGISLLFAVILSIKKFPIWTILRSFGGPLAIGAAGLTLIVLYSQRAAFLLQDLVSNFYDTINFQFASSIERLDFIRTALILLPENAVFGIGSGQFGYWASFLLKNYGNAADSYLIVNNVYLEVWLEFGFLPLLLFIFIITKPLWVNIKKLINSENWIKDSNLSRLILTFSLFAYYLQWVTFSPIFIMPIFILLGLLAKLEIED